MTPSDSSPSAEGSPKPTAGSSNTTPVRGEPHGQDLTRAGAAWVATGVSLVLLIVLIVFILQNQTKVNLSFLGLDGDVAVGVAMLIAAVAGGALVAIAGATRVIQLRRALRRADQGGAGSSTADPLG